MVVDLDDKRGKRMFLEKEVVSGVIKDPRAAQTAEGVTDYKGVDMSNFSISDSDKSRFFAKVIISFDKNKCWVWKNPLDNGYGRFWIGTKTGLAHRISYQILVGDIPTGKQIDHLCRNRSCVNPSHLEPVDIKTNVLRGEGLSAMNARKTHCKRNHPLSGNNLFINNRNQRVCKICASMASARWVAKNAK